MLQIRGRMGNSVLSAILSIAGTNNAAKAIPLKIPEKNADNHKMKVIVAISLCPLCSIVLSGVEISSKY